MKRFRKKINWRSALSVVLVGALLVGSVMGLASIFGKKTKTISSFSFDRGFINENGAYVEAKTSIYTKEMFECQGLTIVPDFEASGTYQVFYYDEMKNFIGATDTINANAGEYEKNDTFILAKYARVMITPSALDENGYKDSDFKIRFYQVVSYANDYTITVNKKQESIINGENKFIYHGLALFDHENVAFSEGTPGAVSSEFIDVTGVDCVQLYISKVQFTSTSFKFYGYDMDATPIMSILDLSKYDVIDCGDYVFVEIDNLDSFGTFQLYLYWYIRNQQEE